MGIRDSKGDLEKYFLELEVGEAAGIVDGKDEVDTIACLCRD